MSRNQINIFKSNGFSLIELSIVLIIIGLIIVGIVGGASLIRSAKTVALINELRGYDTAVNAFYVAKGRLPGDVNEKGTFTGQTFTTSSFPSPYNVNVTSASLAIAAPFIDLYLEKILDFKPAAPTTAGITNTYVFAVRGFIPFSAQSESYFYTMTTQTTAISAGSLQNIALPSNQIAMKYKDTYVPSATPEDKSGFIKAKIIKQVDMKIDDGLYNAGRIRSTCVGSGTEGNNSYDNSIDNNAGCRNVYFLLDLK